MEFQATKANENVSEKKDSFRYTSVTASADTAYLFADMFGRPMEVQLVHAHQLMDLSAGVSGSIEFCANANVDEFMTMWRKDIDVFQDKEDPLYLEESVYKAWTNQKNHPLKGTSGLSFGDPAAHMEAVLTDFGMSVDSEYGLAPDSLSTLFEFLGFLLENQPMHEAVTFCKDHLDWLHELRERAMELNVGMALMRVISLAEIFIQDLIHEMELFDGRTVEK